MSAPETELDRASGVATIPLVIVASLAFAASFGFSFGKANQVHYFLPSARILDPSLFRRDWLLNETVQYHEAFAYVGALLWSLDERGWVVAIAFTLVVAAAMLAIYATFHACAGRRVALPSFLLLVTIAFFTRTRGPGMSYVFDGTLQPSTLGSAFLLLAFPAFVTGRYLVSGLALATAGALHVNILVLGCAAFFVAHLLLGGRDLVRRAGLQLAPALVVVVIYSPMLLDAAGGGAQAALGRSLYLDVRTPHHFKLAGQWDGFVPCIAWLLMALGALFARVRGPVAHRPLAALIGGFVAVIALGTLFASFHDSARVLFSWRLVGHLELLLQGATLLVVTRAMLDPGRLWLHDRTSLSALDVGYTLALYAYARAGQPALVKVLALIGITLIALVALQRSARHVGPSAAWRERWARLGGATLASYAAIVLASFSIGSLRRIRVHSSLIDPPVQKTARVFDWIRRRTPVDALLLTPPDLEATRFSTRRAIVVDWKCNPAIPEELARWRQRLLDVIGRSEIRSVEDLAWYDTMDAARLEKLRASYGVDYAVIRRGREAGLPYHHAFSDEHFVVLKL
jgi:hypothetical protein